MKLNIIIIAILGFSVLFITGQAYAPCIEGPAINCNNYPPPALTQIKTDKLNYALSDKPMITIMGSLDAVAHLEIDDSSSNVIFTHDINMAPNGTVIYVLDISSYKPGVYAVIATSPISKLTTSFAVGLSTTGPIVTLNVLNNTFVQGNFITIVGTVGPNDAVQLSLIDPNDNVITSIQTVSNDIGQYSTSALRIPTDAISGIWKITADHNLSHTMLKIMVQSSASNGVMKSSGPVVITLESPLKQFKSGIKPEEIQCNTGFQLILKGLDNSPACIKNTDVSDFIERSWATRKISVENTDQSLNYIITSGQLEQAKADVASKSLVLTIKTTGNGTLITHLPRSLLDPHINGQDSAFVILEDGNEASFKQVITEISERTLSIPFRYGISTIEIIAPEPIR